MGGEEWEVGSHKSVHATVTVEDNTHSVYSMHHTNTDTSIIYNAHLFHDFLEF